MNHALWIGALTGVLVFIPKWYWQQELGLRDQLLTGVWVIGALFLIGLIFRVLLTIRKKTIVSTHGVSDFILSIYSPTHQDSGFLWGLRAMQSGLLSLLGVFVGSEGMSAELTYALSKPAFHQKTRWFEYVRRTRVACCLVGAISAAFLTPFGAVILMTELGIGGRLLWVGLSSLSAYGASYLLGVLAGFSSTESFFSMGSFALLDWRYWLGLLALSLLCAIFSVCLLSIIQLIKKELNHLHEERFWVRGVMLVLGGLLLFWMIYLYPELRTYPSSIFEKIFLVRMDWPETAWLFLALTFSFFLVSTLIGGVGLFWPVILLGALLGLMAHHYLFNLIPFFSTSAVILCVSGLFGSIFGAPIAVSIMVLEWTRDPSMLVAALICAWIANWIRSKMGVPSFLVSDLSSQGVLLRDGRASTVLDHIRVRDAMVTDFKTVVETQPVSEVNAELLDSLHPVLVVVQANRKYSGLLSADVIRSEWHVSKPSTSNSPLNRLLEAKDLLYRSKNKPPTVALADTLGTVSQYFQNNPCLPVIGQDGRPVGLLFAHNVRFAYDREFVRQSFLSDSDD